LSESGYYQYCDTDKDTELGPYHSIFLGNFGVHSSPVPFYPVIKRLLNSIDGPFWKKNANKADNV
jgi:hypothetical protein